MNGLQLETVSVGQLMAMGDGLLARGEARMARDLYRVALERCGDGEKQRIRARLGLAAAPTPRTPTLLDILGRIETLDAADPFVSEGMATWFKTLPFTEDARFMDLSERLAGLLPIANWQWNLQTVLWAVERCRQVPGDYVELGVFKGHTTLFCAEYVGFAAWPKQWMLYDTFEGIPEDQQAPGWKVRNDGLYKGTYSVEEVQRRFAHFRNIHVIQGKVPDILAEVSPAKIAFMHIDLNNAPAEIAALETLFDRVSSGGIIIFDDYTWSTTRAQYHAEKAWFAARGLSILPLPTGQGVFINP